MKTTFNPKRDLPYLAAIAQTVQFSIAGYTLFSWLGLLAGIFLGALVSMTVAYASSQYFEIAKERKKSALFFMVVLLAFSPIVVGTAAYLELPFTGVWAGVVAAAWGILPDFSVALDGFIAGKGMVAKEQLAATGTETAPQVAPKQDKKPAKVARQPVTDDELRAHLAAHPGETYTATAQRFGVSRAAITKRIEKLYKVTP